MACGGWRGRRDGADESKLGEVGAESPRMCSHPKFDMFFPKNKGFCDYCTPLSHFQSTEMFTAVNFIELYSSFCREKFSDCLTWL